MKIEDIISEILGEMESVTGSYVEPMDSIKDEQPEVINDDEEIDELNSNATTGDMSYNIPGAFRKTDGTEEDETSGFEDGHIDPEVLGYKKTKKSKVNFESEFKQMAKGMFITEGGLWDYSTKEAAEEIWSVMRQKVQKNIISAERGKRLYHIYTRQVVQRGIDKLAFEPDSKEKKELMKYVKQLIERDIKRNLITLSAQVKFD